MKDDWQKKNEYKTVEDLILLHSTNSAYLVRDGNNTKHWLPKSQVQNINYGQSVRDSESGLMVKEIESLELPSWLAKEKGFN